MNDKPQPDNHGQKWLDDAGSDIRAVPQSDAAPADETDAQMLARLSDDASAWAAEFRKTALKLGYSDMDEGWLISWFANAIVTAQDKARPASPLPADATAWLIEFSEKVSRTPAYYGHTGEGLGETTDSLKAVRFARREDAQAIIDDIGWNEARPVEHMWADSKCCNDLSPTSPLPADDVVERAEEIMAEEFLEWEARKKAGAKESVISAYARALAAANLLRQSAPVDSRSTLERGDEIERDFYRLKAQEFATTPEHIEVRVRQAFGWPASLPADVAGMREAIYAERERCASVVENMGRRNGRVVAAYKHVAAQIRSGAARINPKRLSATLSIPESKTDAAGLREKMAALIDPAPFITDKHERHRACSPCDVEVRKQEAYAKADRFIDTLELSAAVSTDAAVKALVYRLNYRARSLRALVENSHPHNHAQLIEQAEELEAAVAALK